MTVQEAIDYIIACRDSHVDVVQYYDAGSTADDWLEEVASAEEALGDREFHQTCIEEYDKVIQVLQEVLQ